MGNLDIPFGPCFVQRLRFTRGVFDLSSRALADLLEPRGDGPVPVLAVIDSGVSAAWPGLQECVQGYLGGSGDRTKFAGCLIVPGGEQAKSDRRHLDAIVHAIHEARLCRRSYVLAIGGGAVLDATGLGAALAHRGVRLVRVPTTTLAQADSGVAVKNGINAFGVKNYMGTFCPAWGVINDFDFLRTLSERDWRCGFAEAVKVGLVKDGEFFEWLEREAPAIARRDSSAAGQAIRRACELHARHIAESGDPFELTHARPLDFGHWAAHRLEEVTGYALRHGEAVAIGIAIDAKYSVLAGLLDDDQCSRIVRCLHALGFDLALEALRDSDALLTGLEEFREHLGGRLTIAMLAGVGRSVDVHEIDADRMRQAVAWVSALHTGAPISSSRRPDEHPPNIPVYV